MTTNAGAIDVSKNKIGFNAKRSNDDSSDAINRIFHQNLEIELIQ